MDNDYPSSHWFWKHLDDSGHLRVSYEMVLLREFVPANHDEAFWRTAEIARIEGHATIPEGFKLDTLDAGLVAEVRASQAQRLATWMAGTAAGIDERMRRRRIPG